MSAAKPLRLHYAVDVTLADVDAATAFVMGRLIEQHRNVGTEEYRVNAALRSVVPTFAGALTHYLAGETVDAAGQDPQKELRRVQGVHLTWNNLMHVVEQWQEIDGFDSERWRRVRFRDSADEESFRRWSEKVKQAAPDPGDFVSEYRIPGARRDEKIVGEFVVSRDPDQAELWAVFEGAVMARHWDGDSWQHARFTGNTPYLFSREAALTIAHQHAADHAGQELEAGKF